MESEKYQVGEHVIINKHNLQVIGKIEEIFEEDGQKKFRFNEYYSPERTLAGKQDHNSKFELYVTDETEKESFSNIQRKCEVLKFDLYIKKLLTLKEKKISPIADLFFFRQKYLAGDDFYVPDLPNTCYCDLPLNPDKNFIQCKKCKEFIHMDCFLMGESKKCFNSTCNNNIENQLQVSTKEETKVPQLINRKRNRENEDELEKKNTHPVTSVDLRNETHQDKQARTNEINLSSGNIKNKDEDKGPEKYQNLTEERRKYLLYLLSKLEKKTATENGYSTPEEKTRRTLKEKILESLLYGIEEIKQYDDLSKLNKNELISQDEIPEATAVSICNSLSVSIETAIFLLNEESVNNNYKKRIATICLNLSDHRNYELRFAILNKDISAEELAKMQPEELAPKSVKNLRMERQQKYFKDQVVIKDDLKIITKTHKGEAILTVDSDPTNNHEFIHRNELTSIKEEDDFNSQMVTSDYENKPESKMNNSVISDDREKSNIIPNISNSNKSKLKELKYKNLSPKLVEFYYYLEEYKKENLVKKFNDKLSSQLKDSTFNEIVKYRQEN